MPTSKPSYRFRHKADCNSIVIYSLNARPLSLPGMEVQNWAGALDVSATGVMPSLEMAVTVLSLSVVKMLTWQRTVYICCVAAVSR